MADESLAGPSGPATVLGAGSWGTALALLLAQSAPIRLWDRTPALIEALIADRENKRYLPGTPLPPSIVPIIDIAKAVKNARTLIVAVPSGAVRAVMTLAAPYLPSACDIVLASKGLEPETGLLPFQVAEEVLMGEKEREPSPPAPLPLMGEGCLLQASATDLPLGERKAADDLLGRHPSPINGRGAGGEGLSSSLPLIALSGPNLAAEMVRGVPAAAVSACPDSEAAERVAALFNRPAFRVYTSDDRIGVEVGGAVKNVLAIAGGVSDGLGFGDNAKAALMTRGLAEMARFGVALGARRETFYGLAGVGDLMATAASRLSRNWRVGEGLAQGEALPTLLQRLGQVAEGVPTAHAVVHLAREKGVDMPVCTAVARLLAGEIAPDEAVASLMTRSVSREG